MEYLFALSLVCFQTETSMERGQNSTISLGETAFDELAPEPEDR
jgi:hypothetical protein